MLRIKEIRNNDLIDKPIKKMKDMKNRRKKNNRKNAQQAAKGRKRARGAKRDEKGRFIKENQPPKRPAETHQPNNIITTNREERIG